MKRREFVKIAGAATFAPLAPTVLRADTLETLALFGPPAGPSITLAHAVAQNMFTGIAPNATFEAWRNPDELRAGLTSGRMQLSLVPVQAAANLYSRGFPIRLANIMTEGLLYIITKDPEINTVASLEGRNIAVAFAGDTPDIILDQLLAHAGLDPQADLTKQPAATPVEAMQLLLAGRADAALVGEPAASAAVLRGKQEGLEVLRGIDIQQAWGDMTGADPVLPQAGLAVTQSFLDDHGTIMPALLGILQQATAAVLADPAAAALDATGALGQPPPLIQSSIEHAKLVATPASDMRSQIESMLTAMGGDGLERIGGALPDDAFYL